MAILNERQPLGISIPGTAHALEAGEHEAYRSNLFGWMVYCAWVGFVPEKVMPKYPGIYLRIAEDGSTLEFKRPIDKDWTMVKGEEINNKDHPLWQYKVSFDPETSDGFPFN